MLIKKALKLEIKLDDKRHPVIRQALEDACKASLYTYNWSLQENIRLYKSSIRVGNPIFSIDEKGNKIITWNKLEKSPLSKIGNIVSANWTKFKNTSPEVPDFVKNSSAQACVQAIQDVNTAFQNFYKRLKNPSIKEKGYPKFKDPKKGDGKSFRCQGFKFQNNKIFVPKIGLIKLKENIDEYQKDIVKIISMADMATVSRVNDRWFVSIKVDCDVERNTVKLPEIGIDVGLKEFACTFDGRDYKTIPNPRFYRKTEKLLKRRQRQLSKLKYGSCKYKKIAKNISNIHNKTYNKRDNFLQELSTELVLNYEKIGVESLTIKGMVKNKNRSKSISDASWGRFIEMLNYKADWYGSEIISADTSYASTQTCSSCGNKKEGEDKLTEKDRTYKCNKCRFVLDRDFNAARNLLPSKLEKLSTGNQPNAKASIGVNRKKKSVDSETPDQKMEQKNGGGDASDGGMTQSQSTSYASSLMPETTKTANAPTEPLRAELNSRAPKRRLTKNKKSIDKFVSEILTINNRSQTDKQADEDIEFFGDTLKDLKV